MDTKLNFYDVLGITPNATSNQIRTAHRELSRRYHPDKNPNNPEAEEKMKEINVVHDVLSDPEKRKIYDASLLNKTESNNTTMRFTGNVFSPNLSDLNDKRYTQEGWAQQGQERWGTAEEEAKSEAEGEEYKHSTPKTEEERKQEPKETHAFESDKGGTEITTHASSFMGHHRGGIDPDLTTVRSSIASLLNKTKSEQDKLIGNFEELLEFSFKSCHLWSDSFIEAMYNLGKTNDLETKDATQFSEIIQQFNTFKNIQQQREEQFNTFHVKAETGGNYRMRASQHSYLTFLFIRILSLRIAERLEKLSTTIDQNEKQLLLTDTIPNLINFFNKEIQAMEKNSDNDKIGGLAFRTCYSDFYKQEKENIQERVRHFTTNVNASGNGRSASPTIMCATTVSLCLLVGIVSWFLLVRE